MTTRQVYSEIDEREKRVEMCTDGHRNSARITEIICMTKQLEMDPLFPKWKRNQISVHA